MNNKDKLLRAFIEAQGFEIKETPTAKSINDRNYATAKGWAFVPELDYDYKVTKCNHKTVDIARVYKQLSFALEKVLHCEPLSPSDVFAICKILGLTNENI